jgi:t-SNARE complex subunit (syntaxin)
MVVRMSDNSVDPSGNTEAFKAFTEHAPQEPATASRTPLIICGIILVVVLAIVIWLVV